MTKQTAEGGPRRGKVQDYTFHAFDAAVVLIRVALTTPEGR